MKNFLAKNFHTLAPQGKYFIYTTKFSLTKDDLYSMHASSFHYCRKSVYTALSFTPQSRDNYAIVHVGVQLGVATTIAA